MQTQVLHLSSACRRGRARTTCRICRNTCNALRLQRTTRRSTEPRCVPWLAGHRAAVRLPQQIEKRQRDGWVIGQTGRKLKQEAAQFFAKLFDLSEERIKQRLARLQFRLMADRARHFDRKAEIGRHRVGPFTVGGRQVRTIEGRIDLHRIEHLRIALQMAAVCGKVARASGRYRPAGDTYVERTDEERRRRGGMSDDRRLR